MENTSRTPQFYRTRKALLLLPLLAIPILALVFWNFNRKSAAPASSQSQGINTSLPGAKFDKHQKPGDKMSFYNQAAQDSAKRKSDNSNPLLQKFGFKTNGHSDPVPPDQNIAQIRQKLADINREISQPQPAALPASRPDQNFNQQVSKLEMLMKSLNSGQGSDPQMQQLSKMLEQVQEIQHPELMKPVVKPPQAHADSAFKAIPAIVDGNQKIVQGGVVRLKLTDTVRIKGGLLSKGQLLFGSCNITNQRLLLDIKNIRLGHAIIPVNLTVFSLDGLPGIPAPEAEISGAAGQGADNALQDMQLLSMDQTVSTEAASAGIDAAKGLLSKKVRRIKVKLKDGFPLLLRNNNQH